MKRLVIIIFILTGFASKAQLIIDIRTLGAVGDGSTINTAVIQQAIDSVTNNGGGEVLVSGGTYMSSTIVLKSNVTLRVTPDATLLAVTTDGQYPSIPYSTRSWNDTYTQHSLIFAESASNIRITGGGTINGNGQQPQYIPVSKNYRPFGFRLHLITGLDIDSITFIDAPQWMGHIFQCYNVHLYNDSVYNLGWGSNDGIDIDCCRNVLVEDCHFDTDDDCIPVKSQAIDTCRDILIRNCTMASNERPVKVGCESLGPIVNVTFQNIVVYKNSFTLPNAPFNAIYCAIADGGSADSIVFENIQVNAAYQTPIFIRLCNRGLQYDTALPPPPVQYLRNVWVKNVVCTSTTTMPCSITGIPGYQVQNIYLENVSLTVPGNTTQGSTNIPELETTRPECALWGDSLPAYGLFVRHENGLYLGNFCIDTESYNVRPEFYFFQDTANFEVFAACGDSVLGTKDLLQRQIRIFPNPAVELLTVTGIPAEAETLSLFNITGSKVLTAPVSGCAENGIDISRLGAGIYFLTLTGQNLSVTRKVIVAR